MRAPAAAGLAVATVALYALGSLSGLFHLAFTRHEVCPEHGKLVHAGHLHGAGATAPGPEGPAVAGPPAPAPHGHDHCGIAGHLRESGLAAPVADLAREAAPAGRAPSLPDERGYRPIAPLLLAPKNSPPAAA